MLPLKPVGESLPLPSFRWFASNLWLVDAILQSSIFTSPSSYKVNSHIGLGVHSTQVWPYLNWLYLQWPCFQIRSLSEALCVRISTYDVGLGSGVDRIQPETAVYRPMMNYGRKSFHLKIVSFSILSKALHWSLEKLKFIFFFFFQNDSHRSLLSPESNMTCRYI